MSELGQRWETALTRAIGLFELMIARMEADLDAGDLATVLDAYARTRQLAARLVDVLDHEPGPEHLPEERVRVLGPLAFTLGERLLALHGRIEAYTRRGEP